MTLIHWYLRGSEGDGRDALRAAFDYGTRSEVLANFDYYPPLWYGGVAALFSFQESLTYGQLILVNGAALAVALWAAWDLGKRTGGPSTGALAVLMVAALPGVAGRMTFVGVEPWQMALLALSLRGLLILREPRARSANAVVLGGLIAAGMLVKWTFVAALLGPVVLEVARGLGRSAEARAHLRRLLLALGLAGVTFSAWLLSCADMSRIFGTDGLTGDPILPGEIVSWDGLMLLGQWSYWGLGQAGLALALLALLGLVLNRRQTSKRTLALDSPGVLLASSAATLGLVHWLIPHKELRYLLPGAWCAGVLIAMGLAVLWERSSWAKAAVAGALAWLVVTTFVTPQVHPLAVNRDFRLSIDRSDHGIGEFVELPPPSEGQALAVLLSGEGSMAEQLGYLLGWEFHARNPGPVATHVLGEPVTGPKPRSVLSAASHFTTNRLLDPHELQLLEELSFRPIREANIDDDNCFSDSESTTWTLWARKRSH